MDLQPVLTIWLFTFSAVNRLFIMHVERCAVWMGGRKRYSPARFCMPSVPSGLAREERRGRPSSERGGCRLQTGADTTQYFSPCRHDARTQEPVTKVPTRNRYGIGPVFFFCWARSLQRGTGNMPHESPGENTSVGEHSQLKGM